MNFVYAAIHGVTDQRVLKAWLVKNGFFKGNAIELCNPDIARSTLVVTDDYCMESGQIVDQWGLQSGAFKSAVLPLLEEGLRMGHLLYLLHVRQRDYPGCDLWRYWNGDYPVLLPLDNLEIPLECNVLFGVHDGSGRQLPVWEPPVPWKEKLGL